MIVVKKINIGDREFIHTFSDIGVNIQRDGVIYKDAIDPVDSGRTYTEVVDLDEEITTEEFMSLIEGVL